MCFDPSLTPTWQTQLLVVNEMQSRVVTGGREQMCYQGVGP